MNRKNKNAPRSREEIGRQLPGIAQAFRERFPPKKIFLYSQGRIQFIEFGTLLQASLFIMLVMFLGWTAYTSVNVIFRDRILLAKVGRYGQMQTAYEERVADLQESFDQFQHLIRTTIATQSKLVACLKHACDPQTVANLARELAQQRDDLKAHNFYQPQPMVSVLTRALPGSTPSTPTSSPPSLVQHIAAAAYDSAEGGLNWLYSFVSPKNARRLDDTTAFHIIFEITWGMTGLALLFLWRLFWRTIFSLSSKAINSLGREID